MPEENAKNVENDGRVEVKSSYQKKTVLFKTLSILWIIPSATSVFIFLYNFKQASGFLEMLKLVRIEQWLALVLFLLHPVFIFFWWHFRKTELPTETVSHPNSEVD